MKKVFNALSFFNVNIDIAAPECINPDISYKDKWIAVMVLPLALAAVLFLANAVKVLWKCAKGKRQRLTRHTSKLVAVWLLLFYFLYLMLLRRALDVFNCNPISPDDGYSYVSFKDRSCGGGYCRCGVGLQQSLKAPAALALTVYSLIWPLWLYWVLRRNRELIKEDQLLRAMDLGETRETNPDAYEIRKRYHKMYYEFKPGKVYWKVYVIARKFLIAFAGLMFRANVTFQLAFICLVLVICYVLQVLHRPYMSSVERDAVIHEHAAKVKAGAKMHIRVEERLEAIKTKEMDKKRYEARHRHRKRHQLGDDGNKEKKTVADVKNYFWDFNTVEATMLFCAIYVVLSGIMFESGQLDVVGNEWQKELITYLLGFVLFFSFCYYSSVFLSEARYCTVYETSYLLSFACVHLRMPCPSPTAIANAPFSCFSFGCVFLLFRSAARTCARGASPRRRATSRRTSR